MSAIRWAVILIVILSICIIASYLKGKADGQREISPPDTVISTREIPVPNVPAKPMRAAVVSYDTTHFVQRIQELTSKFDSTANRADSLESLLTTYLEPFSGESTDSLRAGLATLHYRAVGVAFPLDRSISIGFDSILIDIPETIITQTVEIAEPWYENPAYFAVGLGIGILASILK
jgi:hypothetical protein